MLQAMDSMVGAPARETGRSTTATSVLLVEDDDSVGLRHQDGQDWASLKLHDKDSKLKQIWRALKHGAEWNWLLNRNRDN